MIKLFTSPRSGITFAQPSHLLCTWFGIGLSRVAPGTWGSAAALPLAWFIMDAGGVPALASAAFLLGLIAWPACNQYVRRTGTEDPKEVVVDEVVGQWIALCAAPLAPDYFFAAFVLFRFFDILKPWPVSFADKNIHGGLGIMLDDVLAGFYAWLILTAGISLGVFP